MSTALNIGARALNVNLSTLQVIGHNIANANTAGYSRQSVQLQSAGHHMQGGNFFGKGVEIGSVTRAHDSHLTREAQLARSVAAADAERLQRLQQLEQLFPTGSQGLGASLNGMLNAWADVAAAPANLSARVVALGRGHELAGRLRESASGIDQLAHSSQQHMQNTVQTVNRLAQDIARVNQRLIENQGNSGAPNDLLDQREHLLGQLSQQVQISTVAADDGSLSVFVAGSQPLVLGQSASSLATTRDGSDSSRLRIAFVQASSAQELGDDAIGGQLGGLLGFLGQDVPQMQNQLGRMALALSSQVNTQHRLGLDVRGGAGVDFFVPAPAVQGMAAAGNGGSAQISASVGNPSALQASDYQLHFEAAGVRLTRLSDGSSQSFAGLPADFDGLRFESPTGTAVVGDRFLVRPYVEVARNLQVALGAPEQLAAASPVHITPAGANRDGLAVERLYAVAPSPHLTDPVTLTFLADGSFSATGLGPNNPAPDNPGPPPSYNFTPGQPLLFNGWSLTLRGSPNAGDSFTLAASPVGSTKQNAGNADAVLALRERASFDGVALSDGYSSLLSVLGTQVQSAQFASGFSAQIARSSENARAAVAGVNLDEEAARLLQFQQAYQASAKFLQIAQSTFDTLLQTIR